MRDAQGPERGGDRDRQHRGAPDEVVDDQQSPAIESIQQDACGEASDDDRRGIARRQESDIRGRASQFVGKPDQRHPRQPIAEQRCCRTHPDDGEVPVAEQSQVGAHL